MVWLYIHAKYFEPGCNIFRFMIFLFFSGAPPSDAPEGGGGRDFFFHIGKGVWHDYPCNK